MMAPVPRRDERRQEVHGDTRDRRELIEHNRHMHEFLALLGHELRCPLAAIRNALRVLEEGEDDAATREWAWHLIERQTQRIGLLVEGISEGSRIAAGKVQLRKQRVDLGQTVARAVETVRASVEERGHQLQVALPPPSTWIDADPARLEQVLMNLLTNASKYMEPGGHIWLTAEVIGGEVVLRVRDCGIGIDPEMLSQVFEPYWQMERSAGHAQGGLGLGLALVRKLTEMHGGSASAFSEGPGLGSEFVVRFPGYTAGTGDAGQHGEGGSANDHAST